MGSENSHSSNGQEFCHNKNPGNHYKENGYFAEHTQKRFGHTKGNCYSLYIFKIPNSRFIFMLRVKIHLEFKIIFIE